MNMGGFEAIRRAATAQTQLRLDLRAIRGDFSRSHFWVPIVMQWNFWLSEHWSVFGEPGGSFHFQDDGRRDRADFTLYGGARLRFSDRATLTFRVGHPALSVGFSFLI